MAQDLGFQKDPKHWVSHDSSLASEEDLEIRRRIFWGCYSSDKLVSLILGRPVYLFYDDAEVDTTNRLPYARSHWRFCKVNPANDTSDQVTFLRWDHGCRQDSRITMGLRAQSTH